MEELFLNNKDKIFSVCMIMNACGSNNDVKEELFTHCFLHKKIAHHHFFVKIIQLHAFIHITHMVTLDGDGIIY